jgi:hypothetical protein
MTKDDLQAIKTRFHSIPPRKMQDIRACSDAAYKLICAIPELVAAVEVISVDNSATFEVSDVNNSQPTL